MCAAIISGVDAAPVLDLAKHGFDAIPLAVEHNARVIKTLRLAFEGMQAVILPAAKALRNQSASQPPSTSPKSPIRKVLSNTSML